MSELAQQPFVAFGNVNENDESLAAKTGGNIVFGLNTGNITTLEYNGEAGKDGAPGDAVDITVTINGREVRSRIYDVTRIYSRNGEELEFDADPNSEYQKKYRDQITHATAVIKQAVKATGVTEQEIAVALSKPLSSFADWAKVMTGLIKPGFEENPVDVFLQYQWNIKGDNDRTYLELPKNMKGGKFLIPSMAPVGEWKEEKEWTENKPNGNVVTHKGLRYVDGANNSHMFTRTESFMTSNKAIQQKEGDSNEVAVPAAFGNNTPQADSSEDWD